MEHKVNDSVKITVLLDNNTIRLLKEYATEKFGSNNVSSAIRAIAREYGQKRTASTSK